MTDDRTDEQTDEQVATDQPAPTDDERIDVALGRYLAAAHAVQSGVAMLMNFDMAETTPKHLRVGVNSALVSVSTLGELLTQKGVITRVEYHEAMADAMEEEARRYEQALSTEGLKVYLT